MGDMLKRALFFISIIVPFLIIIKPVVEGNVPFWYDPARDLLMAWDNLRKPTLIGPTSGIPGIFYGPQWIWLLSIGVAISKDPRFVVFLILTLPYFILLPLSIMKLRGKLVDWKTMAAVWLLSIFAFGSYANQIWSPNLAPLLFFLLLAVLYLMPKATEKLSLAHFFLLGLIQGLLLQHHISFGVVLTVAWVLYFVLLFLKRKNYTFLIINTGLFIAGFLIMQLPFFVFEARHGFMQVKSLLYTLGHSGPVVGQVGLTRVEIIQRFIERGAGALSLPKQFGLGIDILILFFIIQRLKKKTIYSDSDKNILLFICAVAVALFFVYFGTRNPIWDYHFIGVEVLFIFLILLAVKKNKLLGSLLFFWAMIVFIIHTTSFIRSFMRHTYSSELVSKKETVKFILNDTSNTPFIYLAKNASVYTYDYDYLFRWVGGMEDRYPVSDVQTAKNIYLIIPNELRSDKIGFTENRTPSLKYKTAQEWIREDKTLVIKRVPIK